MTQVRSLCKHYDTQFREEGEVFEHNGPLYEHVVAVEETDSPQEDEFVSRQQKPAKKPNK